MSKYEKIKAGASVESEVLMMRIGALPPEGLLPDPFDVLLQLARNLLCPPHVQPFEVLIDGLAVARNAQTVNVSLKKGEQFEYGASFAIPYQTLVEIAVSETCGNEFIVIGDKPHHDSERPVVFMVKVRGLAFRDRVRDGYERIAEFFIETRLQHHCHGVLFA